MIKATMTVIAATGVCRLLKPIKASAWFSAAHSDITLKAVGLLEKEGRSKEYNFFKNYIDEIGEGSVEPDREGDPDKGSGAHYYSCVDPKGRRLPEKKGYYKNRLGDFSKSARTMLEENYTSALCLHKSGNIKRAMHVLGRAIHFVEDMSCTVHTSNIKYVKKPTNVHNAYEKHANSVCKKQIAQRLDKRLIKAYEGDSFEAPLHKLIKISSGFTKSISTLDADEFDKAIEICMPLAQQNAAAILLKFYKDCTSGSKGYLTDGSKHTIKNLGSGLVITVTEKGITLQDPSKDKDQKLLFSITDMGSFFLKSEHGYIGQNGKSVEAPGDKSSPADFRFAYLGKNMFRITTGGTGYAKVIAAKRNGSLTVTDFKPKDPSQMWIIE